ncbi:MAG: hypothetical protein ACXWXK_07855 [Actinomycetota bacterium]
MGERRDEAEAADEVRAAEVGSPDEAVVPEADALEQATPVHAPADDEPDAVGDKPEADALEQARGAADDDEDDRR